MIHESRFTRKALPLRDEQSDKRRLIIQAWQAPRRKMDLRLEIALWCFFAAAILIAMLASDLAR